MSKVTNTDEALLKEFPETSAEEWRAAAEQLLKGAPFDKVMKRQTPEGILLEPIFRKEVLDDLSATQTRPGFDGYLRGTKAAGYRGEPWEIAQEMPYGTPAEFNQAARVDLMKGQNALNIILDIATLKGADPSDARVGEVSGCGLSLATLHDLQTAFAGIHPEAVSFHFRSGWAGLTVGGLFFSWLDYEGVDMKSIKGSLGMDPITVQAAAGKLPRALDQLLDEQATLARYCADAAPGVQAVGVSTVPYNQAGASSVEELGIALATGAAYLEAMTERGLSIDEAAQQIRFSFAIGPNFFMEIAKIRAARVLWAQVVEHFGGSPEAQKIKVHARTGFYNKTQKDPYVNMLRTTTESLSAVIAGVDSLCVGNFDEVSRVPSEFSRRVSRNSQIILQEECELTGVVDPAGGSWAVEWLSAQVSEKAWGFLQEIEAAGGVAQALKSGFIADRIAQTAQGQETQLNQRRVSLVGTNVYPNTIEKPLDCELPDYAALRELRANEVRTRRSALDPAARGHIQDALVRIAQASDQVRVATIVEAFGCGATMGEVTRAIRGTGDVEELSQPLSSLRLASKYEAMRDAATAFAQKNGQAPMIYLCNLGPLRRHKARADFTKSFFEAGGFEVVSPAGFESPEAAVAAVVASQSGIVVVCGTDDDYVAQFGEYAQALKQALPELQIILAGYPGEHEPSYREQGMDDFIFIKSNNYEVNYKYLHGLGVL